MKITGEHDFAAARDAVWNGLHDPQVLAATMPGAHKLDPTGPNEYVITVSVGVGSVKGTYDGVFAVTDTADGESPSQDDLSGHVADMLTPHKRPRVVHFVDELPRNEMGKVQKKRLVAP